jgi:oligopeptide/dipeptide ABC transporter ATP-binding protein
MTVVSVPSRARSPRTSRRSPAAAIGTVLLAVVTAACLAGPFVPWLSSDDGASVVLRAGRPALLLVAVAAVSAFALGGSMGALVGRDSRLARATASAAKYAITTIPVAALLVLTTAERARFTPGGVPAGIALLAVAGAWTPVAVKVAGTAAETSRSGHVLASRAAGASRTRVMRKHLFPEIRAVALATALLCGAAVLFIESCAAAAAGPPEGTTEAWTTWGGLLHQYTGTAGRAVAQDPDFWLTVGLITATLAGLMLVAFGLDPARRMPLPPWEDPGLVDVGISPILEIAETLRPGETLAVLGASDAEARLICSRIRRKEEGPEVILLLRGTVGSEVDSALTGPVTPFVCALEPGRDLGVRQMNDVISQIRACAGTRVVLFTDDAGTACRHAQVTAILYDGSVVETGGTDEVLGNPSMAFTADLVACSPDLTRDRSTSPPHGRIAPPAAAPGCAYRDNCPHADDLCTTLEPPLSRVGKSHGAACWHTDLIATEPRGSQREELVP